MRMHVISSKTVTNLYWEVSSLKIKKLKPPCPKCPYKLGLVKTLVNPCPQCKDNGYQSFERFQRESMISYSDLLNDENN